MWSGIVFLGVGLLGRSHALTTNECLLKIMTTPNELNESGCLSNPMVNAMLSADTVAYFAQMFGWTQPYVQGVSPHTYNDGVCALSDWDIDAYRAGSITRYVQILGTLYARPYESCYDKYECMEMMSDIMEQNITYTFGSGLGTYKGLENTCEYLGLPSPAIGLGSLELTSVPSMQDYFIFEENTILMGSYGTTMRAFNKTVFENLFVEWVLKFPTCGVKINSMVAAEETFYDKLPTDIRRATSAYYLVQKHKVNQFSIPYICKTHAKFCKGPNKQYPNYKKCVAYLNALPLKTPECGTYKMMYGKALPCFYKHAAMVAINPGLHCWHIGPQGMDMEGGHKCHAGECATVPAQYSDMDWAVFDSIDVGNYPAMMNALPVKLSNACAQPKKKMMQREYIPSAPSGYQRSIRDFKLE